MKKTVLVLHIVGISMMALWVCVLLNKNASLSEKIYDMETNIPEPTIEYKTDTIYDTVKVRVPYPVYTKVIQKVPVPTDDDSLEIEQKMYTDSTFTAWVSGYMPRLDSIEVYTTIIKDSTIIYQPYALSVKKRGLWLHLGRQRNQNKYFGIGYIVH